MRRKELSLVETEKKEKKKNGAPTHGARKKLTQALLATPHEFCARPIVAKFPRHSQESVGLLSWQHVKCALDLVSVEVVLF